MCEREGYKETDYGDILFIVNEQTRNKDAVMVKDRMDVLGPSIVEGVYGDVDVPQEALSMLMNAIMDVEVAVRIGA